MTTPADVKATLGWPPRRPPPSSEPMSIQTGSSFRHEALLYAGLDDFVDRVGRFVREGLEAGDAILVVVSAQKIGLLREYLGPDAHGVRFSDMVEVGRNPARIIPAW